MATTVFSCSRAANATNTSGRAKSDSPVTRSGFPFGTTIMRRLRVKIGAGPLTSPATANLCMVGSSADANTSTGAPLWICPARVDEPAKLVTTSTAGFAALNASTMSEKEAVSDEAANKVIDPLSGIGAVVNSSRAIIFAHERSDYRERFDNAVRMSMSVSKEQFVKAEEKDKRAKAKKLAKPKIL